MKAIWNKQVIAESDDIINVEGNAYFPLEAVNKDYLKASGSETVCHWKGSASYYDLQVDGALNQDAAWYYSEPRPLADGIKGRVAFWKGVQVVKD
ncbi:MAG: DUF427 domain-containing protein [Bacteroidales bacterium]|nr:DUF427 domain-containing protein [Bacteroidales bacterium]